MKTRVLLFLSAIFFALSGCDTAKQVEGAYNMTQCKYDYKSISALSLAGMDLSNGISLTHIPQITSLLSGKSSSIPLNFTLNLDVTNPNQSAAFLQGLQYAVSIDGIEFTTGKVNQSLNIPSGGTQVLPLTIGFDVATFMKGESKNAVENIVKNFVGIGSEKSNVTIQLKPSFKIANQIITSPYNVPVSFSFGGKK